MRRAHYLPALLNTHGRDTALCPCVHATRDCFYSHSAPAFGDLNATFYADQPLVYPYVPDYHVSMLVGAGSSFHYSLFVPGTLLSASFVFLLFFLAARLSGKPCAAPA